MLDNQQAIRATFERYGAQEEQLHQQMRYQILSALTPNHRRELGLLIGELAIAASPDLQDAATRIDRALSSSEQQRILAAHQAFQTQSRQLREQMRTELQSELPDIRAGTEDREMVRRQSSGANSTRARSS